MATPLILFYAFLLGCVCGLRSMTAPAVVAWGAHLGWLHLEGGLLSFFAGRSISSRLGRVTGALRYLWCLRPGRIWLFQIGHSGSCAMP